MEPWDLSHFRVMRRLGAGGMGVVFEARDLVLGRMVALKLLPEEVADDGAALERFQREAQTVSALNHPHICTLYEIGEDGGRHFLVMERLEGRTLRERIGEGPLPSVEVARLGAQIADALDAAHEAGIVHRDLKASNVFLTRHGAKLLDFGIAKVVRPLGTSAPDEGSTRAFLPTLTGTGQVVGTLGYMSPEQLRGESIDARSDLFSLGVLLYEMATAELPFRGDSLAMLLQEVLGRQPEPPSRRVPSVDGDLEEVILRALEKTPERRYQSARELEEALSALLHPGASATASGPAVAPSPPSVSRTRTAAAESSPATVRLAVLPFENLGPADDEYFADGVTEDVRARLAAFPGLEVIARGSAMQYKASSKSPREIASELGVDYLLTGTVRWQKIPGRASRIRVSPELVEVRADRSPIGRWQDTWDAVLEDVFAVQDDLATRAAEALGVALGTTVAPAARAALPSLAAYDVYLRAMDISDGLEVVQPAALSQAIELYEQAVEIDPGFALAWARLSMARSALYLMATRTRALDAAAREAAERAAALAPTAPETRLAFGQYLGSVRKDQQAALRELEAGLEEGPGNPDLALTVAINELAIGRFESGIKNLQRAALLNPRSASVAEKLGRAQLWQRRYAEARAALRRAMALAPTNLSIVENLAMISLAEGDLGGAREVFSRAAARIPLADLAVFFASYWDLAWMLEEDERRLVLAQPAEAFGGNEAFRAIVQADISWLAGDVEAARAAAERSNRVRAEQLEEAPDEAQIHVLYGVTLAMVGERDSALEHVAIALELTTPLSSNAWLGAYVRHRAMATYGFLGEPNRALDLLEELLEIPYFLSPGWLRLDPHFDVFRAEPRFRRLLEAG